MKALRLYTHTHTHTHTGSLVKEKAGITLIALVITIIVLLILAGVSIATLTGNNGILTQANDAKMETRANSVKEARDLWETNKTMDQRTGTSTAQTLEQLVDDLTAQGLLTEDEKDKIIGNEEKGIEAQYGITIGKTVITFSRPIAKVEPDNISDWEYTIDDDGFATITCYKGNDTKVVIPNSINGVDVKRVNKYNGKSNNSSHSIWADNICKEKGQWISATTIGQGTIIEVTVSEGIEEIGTDTFCSSVALEKLDLPSTLRKLGERIIEYCPSLTELNIPNGIKTIDDWAFDGYFHDDKLETITIPDSVTSIGNGAFRGRKGLKNINIPKGVTNIGNIAFANCGKLENIKVDENNENYKLINGMLYNKEGTKLIKATNKEEVVIPNGTKEIETNAFTECDAITSITIPNSITTIGYEEFRLCTSLKDIKIPESVTKIEEGAFEYCSLLEKITIPSNVTEIGGRTFGYCTALKTIMIPENVKKMGYNVFNGDTITVNVYFKENEKPKDWDSNWNKCYWWDSGKTKVTVNYAK